ncbi:TrmH family RNA methyltransferase [Propionibacterium sp.]|uniref:TrmH family RNA methyltransferase n=1 Tax=Propionibacterium sp. TaxID=1977903 RepID=UPI00345E4997
MAQFANHEPNASLPEISGESLRSARRLLQHKHRAETGFFLAEGAQAVREALRSPGAVDTLVVDDPARHQELVDLALDDGQLIDVVQGSSADLASLSDTKTPQGIIAVCHWSGSRFEDIAEPRLVVICAQVRDPGNAGTVVRCADAFGADAVVLTHGSVDITNPKTVRASVGSIFHLPIISGVELTGAIEWAHASGLQVLAADGSGQPMDLMAGAGQLGQPTAWLMGNEAWGLPRHDLELADRVAAVPMWGAAESLNLSTAAAICLYATASAQRRAPEQQPNPEGSH